MIFLILLILLCPQITLAQEQKIEVADVRTIDGDTLEIFNVDLPNHLKPNKFRIYGIDTPESKKQFAKCKKEMELGLKAKKFTEDFLNDFVFLSFEDHPDKYGRILIRVRNSRDQYLSNELIKAGLAVEYYGDKKTKNWCK
jgi:endonuclease YncB( thermonuclease family)